jgi:serine/threonine protein kinase/DNA-binding CsgD family transcriptional regulator
MADRVGQHVGNYRLVALLGQGGFAEVYLGQHVRLNLQVAIKVLHTHLTEQEVEHFQQEAETIAQLQHPAIVRILDYDVQDGVPFLVMDYVPGGSLRRRYPKGTVVPLPQILSSVKQVAAGLYYAHERKFIHRDVKPENILVGRQEEVLLSDFGLAALAHSSASLSTQEAIGTLPYMAPEQIEGHPRAASDQYALGIVVYEWLCGSRPFEGSATEVMMQQLTMPPPPLHEQVATIPLGIEQVVLRALAKEPKERFASVQDFAEALEQASQRASSPPGLLPSVQPSPGPAIVPSYTTAAVVPSHMGDATEVDEASDQRAVPTPMAVSPGSSPSPKELAIPPGQASFPTTKEASEPPSPVGQLERRLVTVLFCDLVGFTPLSEQLDPEDVREIQGVYFGRMSQEIRRFGGSIEKYAGDAVLALFGVPVAHEDDAARAVRCGLSMQAVIKEVAAGVGKRWGVELALRVGVNTGEVVSGIWDIGGRQDYAVSGDAVNTAARLQAVAEPGEVLVGEETMWLARRTIRFGERRAVVLKGKAGVVPVYSAIEERQRPSGWGERGQPIPLVGRNHELTFLSSIWTKVMQEVHPHLVTVLGEPGIGKSRLVAAFEGNLVNQARILHGRCLPYGEVRGYWALAEVVREAAGITLADDMQLASRKFGELVAGVLSQTEDAGDPRELTGHLARLCGLDVDGERPATLADQRTLHTSVCRFIEALARSQPLCLLFEDLHWADEALLDLIEFITAHVREAPLLMMTQARPELLEQRPAWGRGLRNCTSLALEPLDERHGRDLALLLCQEHGLAAGAAEQVVRGAAGNPLFAEELVATIAERGGTAGIPAAIKALIAARLDRLPPQERRALQLAAVIGKVFWEGGLHALGAAGEVTEHLEALKQKELLRTHPRSQMHDDRQYAFKHDLIRDVAYERISRADRRLLHRRLVGWIELISGERVGEYLDLLAHHAFQAGAWEQALAYAQRAGEQAQRLYAPRAAIEQFTRALEATHHLALAPVPALYHARGQAYETLGDFEQARHDYEQALGAAHEAHDDVAEWQSLLDLGFLWAGRDYQQTGAYFRRAIERARALADPKLLAHSLNRLGNWYLNVEQPHEALRYHQEALATFEGLHDHSGIAETLDLLGMVGSLSGDLLQSAAYYEQAIVLFRELDERQRLPSSLANLMLCGGIYQTETLVPAAVGFAESLHQGELALKLAGEIGQRSDEAYTLIHMAMFLGTRGEYARALEVAQRGLAIAQDIEHRQWMTAGHWALGALYFDLLELPMARQHLEQALRLSQEIGSLYWIYHSSAHLASVCSRLKDLTRAESLLTAEPASDAPPQTQAQRLIWYARAQLALAQGEPYRTLAITEQLFASAAHVAGEQSIPHLAHLRGEALAMLNRPAEAETALQAAHTGAVTRGLQPLLWRVSIDLGNLYRAQRRDEEAEQAKAFAQELIEALAATLPDPSLRTQFLQQARALLPRDEPLSPRRAAKGVFGGLTEREREVATLIAQGKANREIADILVVNYRTVEKHIENILSKLGFASRTQIAVWATEKGLGGKEQ